MDFNVKPQAMADLYPLKDRKLRFETMQLHSGAPYKDPATNAKAIPIYNTVSFVFDSAAQGAALFDQRSEVNGNSNIYSRIGNPTVDVFERRVAALEGGIAAVAASSGQAAQFMALTCIANHGDNIISSSYIYGGTHNQLKVLFARYGITTKFAEGDGVEAMEALIDDRTRCLFVESIGNPRWNVPDIPALAAVAKKHGIPLVVDNTFGACGTIARPLDLGADIVVESATKWIGGHGTVVGGVVVDSGRFNWGNGKFPGFTQPVEGDGGWVGTSLVGKTFWDMFGEKSFTTKLRYDYLRDLGACLAPMSAWLLIQGLETLSLRVERHLYNAQRLAEYLEAHPRVAWVSYLGLKSHPYHERAQTLLQGMGCVLSFGVRGGRGDVVVDALRLHSSLANIGTVHSLVVHPATTTHSQLSAEDKLKAGVTNDLLRVSVGTEHIDDILEDFAEAFKVADALEAKELAAAAAAATEKEAGAVAGIVDAVAKVGALTLQSSVEEKAAAPKRPMMAHHSSSRILSDLSYL